RNVLQSGDVLVKPYHTQNTRHNPHSPLPRPHSLQVFDRVNADGVYCNLVTGQERKEMPFAHHTACTIEMANLSTPVDVAVIDEIQEMPFAHHTACTTRHAPHGMHHTACTTRHAPHGMHHTACTTIEMANLSTPVDVAAIDEIQMIRDDYRGWAWTRALLGVQAAEVYACGDPSMISDDYRGWAWTRALLGVQAAEVHVCGDPSVLPLLRAICDATGDAFECHHYHRFAPLTVDQTSLQGDLGRVSPGDCIVAFSRREIFEIKPFEVPQKPCSALVRAFHVRAVEMTTKHRCCVVYGALPPETRRQQARLFNEEESDFRVLVASDAIGMGLNLSIRRVVFSTLHKFNGEEKIIIPSPMVRTGAHMGVSLPSVSLPSVSLPSVSLPSVPLPSDSLPSVSLPSVSPSISFPTTPVKQIAGRAGRRGSRYEEGVVTCLDPTDMPLLIAALQEPVEPTTAAGLFPLFEQVEVFASQLPDVSFARLLDRFVETSKLDGTYFLCRTDNIRRVATMLDKIKGLTLRDRFAFCSAPANARDPTVMAALLRFAHQYAEGKPVPLLSGGRGEEEKLGDEERSGGWEGGKGRPGGDSAGQWVRGTWQRTAASDLMALETKHQVASLYLWLSYQFPEGAFPDASLATDKAQNAAKQLSTALLEARTPNLSSSFGKPGSVRDRYGPGLTDVQQQQLWYIEQQKRRREEERRKRAEGVGGGGRKGEGEEEEEGGVDDEMRQLIASARLKRSAGRRKLSAGASQR
ncbi:unnamed protein product, partial [Closterium sp. NIES-65]